MTIDRLIAISPVSIVIAVAALLAGIIEVMLINQTIYPLMRRRHERKKVTGTQGRDPAILMNLIRLQGLVALPVLGFLFGEHLFGNSLRDMLN
ncbi:MAG TPA: hypothetical protein VKA79_13025 [Aestuariivirgaceae bacterium]|nr:hypothetical protein [Aestuariivirgaceae bacterium]